MSFNQQVLSTNNQLMYNYDLSKVFLMNNRYQNGTFVNSTYSTIVLPLGTIVGRVAATGNITPVVSTASDGSQYPIGVLAGDYSVLPGASVNVMFGVCGDIAAEEIGFITATGGPSTDTFSIIVGGRQLFDRIQSDSVGLFIKFSTDLTDYDNPTNP
jgi:hypothetical protein